jgi:hypothetical protein
VTREQAKAALVEQALRGDPVRNFGLRAALLSTTEYCEACGHNTSWTKITYEDGTKFPPSAVS